MAGFHFLLSLFVLVSALFHFVDPDVFSAVCKLEAVVADETEMIQVLDYYVQQSKKNGNSLPDSVLEFVNDLKVQHQEALVPHYAENPINAFHLVLRVHFDWSRVLDEINCEECIETAEVTELMSSIEEIQDKSSAGPVMSADCEGAALALIRLWETYKLDLQQMFNGTILGSQTKPLSSTDIIYITSVTEDRGMHKEQVIWLKEYLLFSKKNNSSIELTNIARIHKRLANAYFLSNMPDETIKVLKEYLKSNPENKSVWRDLKYYEMKLKEMPSAFEQTTRESLEDTGDPDRSHYQALCRGDVRRSIEITSKLTCIYRKTVIPFYFGKEEILSYDPRLSMFHDAITEAEQTVLKNKVLFKLFRSEVTVDGPKVNVVGDNRISQTAWLHDTEDPTVRKVSHRVQLLTGLSIQWRAEVTDAEPMQVLNYGVGGMYETHLDWFIGPDLRFHARDVDIASIRYSGNRIATWLYYLSNVEAGGATVFTRMNVTVPVVKGAAAFWYNMERNGNTDYRTTHAGCPVLLGSKWVANKWIREVGQAFTRPCGLSQKSLYD